MTAGRIKKLAKLETRLADIIGELTGLIAVEYAGGKSPSRSTPTVETLDTARTDLKYALELLERVERRETNGSNI